MIWVIKIEKIEISSKSSSIYLFCRVLFGILKEYFILMNKNTSDL